MRTLRLFCILLFVCIAATPLHAIEGLIRREWNVDGLLRSGMIFLPHQAETTPTPVVFVFHGHSGTMQFAQSKFALNTFWPEAISVYLQGLPTPGQITDPEGVQAGWQYAPGHMGDRDIKLFDTVLSYLQQQFKVDPKRIYATGHSNGGGFTYLLWQMRGDRFAAFAPAAAAAIRQLPFLKPKSVLHIAGQYDELVKFAWQQATIEGLKRLDRCGAGQPWETVGTLYPSQFGEVVATYLYPGGHAFPTEAAPLIVKFFKEHPKP